MVGEPANPFRINSGRYGVCTTFGQTFESFRKAETKLVKQGFLVRRGLGDPAKANLAAIGGGKDDIGALRCRQQS